MDQLAGLFGQFGIQPFLNHTRTLIVLIDSKGHLQAWNPTFEQISNVCLENTFIQKFLTPAHQPIFNQFLQAKEQIQANLEFNFGSKISNLMCLLVPIANEDFLLFAEVDQSALDNKLAQLTSELEQIKHTLEIKRIDLESVLAQAHEVSHTDPLTFLPNRRQIIADLQRAVAACDQNPTPLTIFMLDIDHFKLVNDTFGHLAGDQALRAMASHLLESIREEDEIGRYGGEEFIVLLPGTGVNLATKIAERLLNAVRELNILFDEKTIKITVSLGIAQYRIGGENWEELLKRADMALYQSKQNGRDRWTLSEIP